MNFKLEDNNGDNKKNKLIKIIKTILIAAFVILCLFLFFKYVVFWFLPFIIAWIIAFLIQPAVKFLTSKLKLKRKLATVLFLLILFSSLVFIIFLAVDRIIYELNSFSVNYSDKFTSSSVADYIDGFFSWIEEKLQNIPFFNDPTVIENIKVTMSNSISDMLSSFGSDIVSKIPSFITSIFVFIPKMLIYIIITTISTFYISLDYSKINKFISIQIPPKIRNVLLDIKTRFLEAIYKYIKAYSIIFIITYAELTVGMLIIGIKYAFILAALIALGDILPVIGTGTFLIPWGIISIIQKDYFTGFALLILYATVTIIRNIIEPKIVGTSLGLYPVATLISMYLGYNLLGIAGMFLLPISLLIVKNLNDEGKIHIWKNVNITEPESNSGGHKKDKK